MLVAKLPESFLFPYEIRLKRARIADVDVDQHQTGCVRNQLLLIWINAGTASQIEDAHLSYQRRSDVISDLELQGHVLDELEFEPSVNAAHIGVIANKGVVTLTGFVMSYAEKLAAERAARRVKGVKAIAEEIEVRLPSDTKHADDEIAGAGRQYPQMAGRAAGGSDHGQGRTRHRHADRPGRMEISNHRRRKRNPQADRRRRRDQP